MCSPRLDLQVVWCAPFYLAKSFGELTPPGVGSFPAPEGPFVVVGWRSVGGRIGDGVVRTATCALVVRAAALRASLQGAARAPLERARAWGVRTFVVRTVERGRVGRWLLFWFWWGIVVALAGGRVVLALFVGGWLWRQNCVALFHRRQRCWGESGEGGVWASSELCFGLGGRWQWLTDACFRCGVEGKAMYMPWALGAWLGARRQFGAGPGPRFCQRAG